MKPKKTTQGFPDKKKNKPSDELEQFVHKQKLQNKVLQRIVEELSNQNEDIFEKNENQ
jgi:hypothetical protein